MKLLRLGRNQCSVSVQANGLAPLNGAAVPYEHPTPPSPTPQLKNERRPTGSADRFAPLSRHSYSLEEHADLGVQQSGSNFIDTLNLVVASGRGGSGGVAFHREKFKVRLAVLALLCLKMLTSTFETGQGTSFRRTRRRRRFRLPHRYSHRFEPLPPPPYHPRRRWQLGWWIMARRCSGRRRCRPGSGRHDRTGDQVGE